MRSIEEQFDNFVRDLHKYDKILGEVAKSIEQIGGEGEWVMNFYPSFIAEATYTDDE